MARAALVALLTGISLLAAACSAAGGMTASVPDGHAPAPTFAPTTGPAPTFGPTTSAVPATTPPTAPTSSPSLTWPEVMAGSGGGVLDLIGRLKVAPERGEGYRRDLFGGAWIDADSDGCDTRCEVLARERRGDLPGVSGGGWLSLYDDYTTPDPAELDIDHVVPLAEAWRSGASDWDGERRIAFANDVDHAGALVAVTAASNRSKSDRDPAAWQPPSLDAWCDYITSWTTTKLRWDLSADEAEVRALANMANARGC